MMTGFAFFVSFITLLVGLLIGKLITKAHYDNKIIEAASEAQSMIVKDLECFILFEKDFCDLQAAKRLVESGRVDLTHARPGGMPMKKHKGNGGMDEDDVEEIVDEMLAHDDSDLSEEGIYYAEGDAPDLPDLPELPKAHEIESESPEFEEEPRRRIYAQEYEDDVSGSDWSSDDSGDDD